MTRHDPSGQAVACVELDRFCERCAYNLRTLPVFRDERTGIPVVRCTECGHYQTANDTATVFRPWLHRLTSLALGLWVVTMIAAFVWLLIAEAAISYATLDELTVRGGTVYQQVGNSTVRTAIGRGPLEVWSDMPDFAVFVWLILAASGGIGFVFGLLIVVILAHWRRLSSYATVVLAPLLPAGACAMIWNAEAPHLLRWGLQYIGSHGGSCALGGCLGVAFGRPLARFLVTIFLPPTLLPRLAYLWRADGRDPPGRR